MPRPQFTPEQARVAVAQRKTKPTGRTPCHAPDDPTCPRCRRRAIERRSRDKIVSASSFPPFHLTGSSRTDTQALLPSNIPVMAPKKKTTKAPPKTPASATVKPGMLSAALKDKAGRR
jgi:hypothetical protein